MRQSDPVCTGMLIVACAGMLTIACATVISNACCTSLLFVSETPNLLPNDVASRINKGYTGFNDGFGTDSAPLVWGGRWKRPRQSSSAGKALAPDDPAMSQFDSVDLDVPALSEFCEDPSLVDAEEEEEEGANDSNPMCTLQ